MTSQEIAHSAKHAGINIVLYLGICAFLAVSYAAYDTNFFTKPFSWWRIADRVVTEK